MLLLALTACPAITGTDDTGPTTDDSDPSTGNYCEGPFDDSSPSGPDCLTGTISCGETLTGHTRGGSSILGSEFYESAFCFVPFEDNAGPERVYELVVEQPSDVFVTMESDCGVDLSFAVALWYDEETCPSGEDHAIGDCNGYPQGSGNDIQVFADKVGTRYIVAVDSSAGSPGPFRLSVECSPR
jgi:hypothetical protein